MAGGPDDGSAGNKPDMDAPSTRYASTPLGDIAYQTVGEGSTDLLLVNPMSRCIDRMWDYEPNAAMLMRLARSCRLIMFDRRGCGISDPLPADLPPTWEDWLDDILTVLDDAGAADAVLLAERDAASASLLFASSHPERVRGLVLCNTSARFRIAPGYPCGERHERAEQLSAMWQQYWGTERMVATTRPSLADNPEYVRWVTRMQRAAYSPRRAGAEFRYIINFDARAVLTAISAPTLVVHRRDFEVVPVAHGKYLAENIEGARLELLPGSDMDVLLPNDDRALALIEEFLAGTRAARADGKVLSTVVLAEVPDDEEWMARLGDVQWNELHRHRRAILQQALTAHQGQRAAREDLDLMVAFDGPARALRFAQALRAALREQLQLDIRVAAHTGECVRTGSRLDGQAVAIGESLLKAAKAGEVVVSAELMELAKGSGLAFRSLGARHLEGEDGERELFMLEG